VSSGGLSRAWSHFGLYERHHILEIAARLSTARPGPAARRRGFSKASRIPQPTHPVGFLGCFAYTFCGAILRTREFAPPAFTRCRSSELRTPTISSMLPPHAAKV